jgi:hypothetical protein
MGDSFGDTYNWYEGIREDAPVRFHLDVEVEDVQQEEVDESEVSIRKRLTHIGFSEDE